jgi:hypothetical protein
MRLKESIPGFRRAALWVGSLALLLRLGALAATYSGNDSVNFWEDVMIARNLLAGRGYALDNAMREHLFYGLFMDSPIQNPITEGVRPTAVKTPLYPLLVAVVFRLFGDLDFLALFIVHAVISAGTAVVVMLSLWRLTHLGGFVAGIGCAIYPPFIFHAVTSPESTSLLMLWLAVLLFLISRTEWLQRPQGAAVLGLVVGLLALIEPVTIPFTVGVSILTLATGARRPRTRFVVSRLLVAASMSAAVVAPWIARNLTLFGAPRPMKTGVGMNLLRGFEYSAGLQVLSDSLLQELERRGHDLDEAQEDAALQGAVLRAVVRMPGAWATALGRNFVNFWWEVPSYQNNASLEFTLGRRLPYILLLLLGVPATAWAFRRFRSPALLPSARAVLGGSLLLIIAYTLTYTTFGAWNLRFHLPVELFMIVLISLALDDLASRPSS